MGSISSSSSDPSPSPSTPPPASSSLPASSASAAPLPQTPTSPSAHSNPPQSPTSLGTSASGGGGWTISPHRPLNPNDAPGVMIAPWARPPRGVVEMAFAWEPSHASDESSTTHGQEEGMKADELAVEVKAEQEREQSTPPEVDPEADTTDTTTTTTPSSAVTPTTIATTVPGSPVSSATSVSVSTTPAKVVLPTTTTPTSTVAASSSSGTPVEEDQTKKVESTESKDAKDASTPAPAPAPAVPPPKKSWASLLPPSGSGAPTTKAKPLPTSSQVGFSVPAQGQSKESVARAERLGKELRKGVLGLLSAPPAASASPSTTPFLIPRGLINTGNMCFANAILQTLVYCQPFSALFAGLGFGGGDDGVLRGAPLVRATGAFLREFLSAPPASSPAPGAPGGGAGAGRVNGGGGKGKGKAAPKEPEEEEREAFIPTGVYDALKGKKRFDNMRGGHQEDAEEFLGFFLDTLEEELLAVVTALAPPPRKAAAASASTSPSAQRTSSPPNTAHSHFGAGIGATASAAGEDGWLEVGRKNRTVVMRTIKSAESPITRIFGGKLRSTLRAPGQKDSVVVEDWRSLRLDIQHDGIHTISDALAFISHPQPVQLTHPAPTASHATLDASQQVLLDGGALPPVLVLHIKRFCYDTAVGGVVKVGKRVAFGPELEIGADVMTPTPAGRKAGQVRYKLFGAIYHHGASASGGHYTLDVLHPTRFGPLGTGTSDSTKSEGWVRIDDELVSDVRPSDVFSPEAQTQGEREGRCAYLLFYRRIR
ncbi:hypothetical protein B0H16DRAFT_1330669 [Mycena metata]|uniref:ubiquitinyl hydrolase 1 n=1 Tax=Mycena metata TaxID=1033252 RepID=A0AAD7HWT0_9AGAR|nr:hypothetical protein B0H16DRAFT_1330669 [Mycena metata]